MEKRYTLPVAIALVVGTVIGSGIFFKAENVLKGTGGNLGVGVLAFVIMGFVMIISAGTFGIVAQSHEGIEGLVGYARASCGKTYGYYMGWFMATVYYPSLTGVLSWLPARYFGVLLGWDDPIFSGRTMALAGGFLVLTYAMNALAPKLAGKFAISTTVIKLIPLLLMAVVGTVVGLSSGMTKFNFTHVVTDIPFAQGLFGAVVALAFAFEGWICATSIGAEGFQEEYAPRPAHRHADRGHCIHRLLCRSGRRGGLLRAHGQRRGRRQNGLSGHLRAGGRRLRLRVRGHLLLGHLQRPDGGCHPRHL